MHTWVETGRSDLHVEFPTKTQGVRKLNAVYVRCANCGQVGFRNANNPGSKVVYTWTPEYDVGNYTTWTTENLLNHQMWLSDDMAESGDDNVDEIVKINNVLEDRKSCECPQ